MADRELAAKLAKRRSPHEALDVSPPPFVSAMAPPPPPPPAQIPHPCLLPCPDYCIDDLINETLKRRLDTSEQRVMPIQQEPDRAVAISGEHRRDELPQFSEDRLDELLQFPVQQLNGGIRRSDGAAMQKARSFEAPTVPIIHHAAEANADSKQRMERQAERARRAQLELEQRLVNQRTKKLADAQPPPLAVVDEPAIWETTPIISPPLSSCSSSFAPSSSFTSSETTAIVDNELAAKLQRRNLINEGESVPAPASTQSLYAEFHEFSRKQMKHFAETFKKYDENKDGFIDFNELKLMMERLGEAQTHIALKEMIKKVDEDKDGKVNLREFLLLFRFAATGELNCSQALMQLAQCIDVTKEGVGGAAGFFQAKIDALGQSSKFEQELLQERAERNEQAMIKKESKDRFQSSKSVFL